MRHHKMLSSLTVAAALSLGTAANAAVVNQVIFSDHTYADADWTVVLQPSSSDASASAFQVATGGNPGSFREAILNTGESPSFIGQLNKTYVYDPSSNGAITGITYNMDLIGDGATYFALISQNGNLYAERMHTASADSDTWQNKNLVLDLADFLLIPSNAQRDPLSLYGSSQPDFSVSGPLITFGYLVDCGALFSGCSTGIDNDPILLTVTPRVVPEPTALVLFLLGMSVLGVRLYWKGNSDRACKLLRRVSLRTTLD